MVLQRSRPRGPLAVVRSQRSWRSLLALANRLRQLASSPFLLLRFGGCGHRMSEGWGVGLGGDGPRACGLPLESGSRASRCGVLPWGRRTDGGTVVWAPCRRQTSLMLLTTAACPQLARSHLQIEIPAWKVGGRFGGLMASGASCALCAVGRVSAGFQAGTGRRPPAVTRPSRSI